jgi:hypothetical protein
VRAKKSLRGGAVSGGRRRGSFVRHEKSADPCAPHPEARSLWPMLLLVGQSFVVFLQQ